MVQQKGHETTHAIKGEPSKITPQTKRYMDTVAEKAGVVSKKLDKVVR